MRAAIIGILATLLAACRLSTGTDCHAVASYALRVIVTDSISGLPPSSTPSLTVVDGAFSESHTAPNLGGGSPNGFLAAKERAGEYQVVVRAAGFADWTRVGIRAERKGACRVLQTAQVNARLGRL